MEAKAIAKSVRISPIKGRLVVDLIRGKKALDAQVILRNYNNKAARLISKVLDSAIANAVNNNGLKKEDLIVSEARIDMEKVLGKKVYLEIYCKTIKKWRVNLLPIIFMPIVILPFKSVQNKNKPYILLDAEID